MPGQGFWLTAFAALMNDRQWQSMTGVPLPISYLAISQYWRDRGQPPEGLARFAEVLGAIDEAWRAHVIKKLKAKGNGAKAGGAPGRP